MIELVNGFLWVITILLMFVTGFSMWFNIVEAWDGKNLKWIKWLVMFLISIGLLYYSSVKVNIIEAESTIKSFQDVKQRKEELGDSYILEPSILTKYSNAVQTLEKYRRLGFYKGDYAPKTVEVKIIDETGANKYCGCSPCECIGECKCTKNNPFPGYEKIK